MKARHVARGSQGKLRHVFLVLLLLAGASLTVTLLSRCRGQHALLLTVTATSIVDTLDIKIKDLPTGKLVLERLGEKIDPKNPNRDISKPGQELKLALEFEAPGNYLIYMQGQGPKGKQFFVRDFQVDGVREDSAHLVPLTHDEDGDGFPSCEATELCGGGPCAFFDCNDADPNINPMAKEVCNNGIDDDCSAGCKPQPGTGDATCEDADNDGEPSSTDCDDHDPCRSHKIKEAAGMCGQDPASFALPPACQQSLTPPYCGDGIDQDCNGQDAQCVTDEDCDGFSPPLDCDDHDPKINPAAQESCDGKDNNCNRVIDEGCVPCDVDGDGHALPTVTDPNCKAERDEIDDYDAGIHPKTTAKTGGAEGGNVLGALRGWCSATAGLEKDGKAPRDVDHDGDKVPASQDGCPTANCDVDGDGFPGKQCNPPASLEDCDDNDPHTFPGAPDKCGDGKAQNCIADTSCACDQDGDGYCPPLDCNDADPTVHPWAAELCNGKDDDCDELTDEANPDPAGKPMPVTAKNCNDDNDGFCGDCKWANSATVPPDTCKNGQLLSGLCVCSPNNPKTKIDPANRVACGGENLAAKASPRCIGARQPELKERCDFGDYDCQNGDIKPGEDFVDKGRNCSITRGECVTGTVVDCKLASPYPHLELAKTVDPSFSSHNKYWVCSGKLPIPELCNGRDDDCNGSPGPTEVDKDGDNYLACSPPCTNFAPRTPPIAGCGDCNDNNASVFPGAQEVCNGTSDDNCNGKTDEAPNNCTAQAQTCCPVVNSCKAVGSDFYHCTGCNQACAAGINNLCEGGVCKCGGGPSCATDQMCQGAPPGGSCGCDGSFCGGCCDNSHCRKGDAVSLCGTGGAACQSCADSNECTQNLCVSGGCQNPPVASGTSCQSGAGRCQDGNCCSGVKCWDGGACITPTTAECGNNGANCAPCNPYNECDTVSCSTGSCVHAPKSDGTACTNGRCFGGSCCAGLKCWDGGACITPTASKCGNNGANCAPCTPGTCQSASCSTGSCAYSPQTGSPCSGGTCLDGTCCTDCIDGSSCALGTANNKCGSGGITCVDCTASGRTCVSQSCSCAGCWQSGTCYINDPARCGPSCTNCPAAGTCKVRTCSGSTCGTANAPDGTNCSGGKCLNGACCTTCIAGGACDPTGTGDGACGSGGVPCDKCTGGAHCTGGVCK